MDNAELQTKKGIKFVHINVRSIIRKLDEIAITYNHVDFLLCSETWLDKRYPDSILNIENFKLFRNDRCNADPALIANNKVPTRGGGVLIYVNSKWSTHANIYNPGTCINEDIEALTLTIKKPGNRHMMITCVYRPPRGNIGNCANFLETIMLMPENIGREKWILGDLNVDFLERNNVRMDPLKHIIKENGFAQLIKTHTRLNRNGGSCLDWIITDSAYVHECGVLHDLLSDHFPIFCVRKKSRENIKREWKMIRIYKNYDRDAFVNLLNHSDWNQFELESNPDVLWDIISQKIDDILSVMCPYKRVYVRSRKTPWITPEIVYYINERKKCTRILRKTNGYGLFDICKFLRNKVNKLIRAAKSRFIQNSMDRNISNPKKFWRIINSLIKTDKLDVSDIIFVDPMTNIEIPLSETSTFLNHYFVNIGSKPDGDPVERVENVTVNNIEFADITIEEIVKYVKEIDITKDSCILGITTRVLKDAFLHMSDKLLKMFASSMSQGIFPRKWAIGYVNILPKSGDLKNPSNWRPITQTCVPAKIMEKVIHKRFLKFLLENGLINEQQYGFLPGKSTQMAVFDMITDMYESLNRNYYTGVLFLDVRKAFDSLNHNILLNNIDKLGFNKKIIAWFESYLDRVQIVRHAGTESCELKTTTGIPQGSILGPTLFIYYINEIFNKIKNVNVKMFADDCVLYYSSVNWQNVHQRLQSAVDKYVAWGECNNLLLNVNKTKAMIIGNRCKLNTLIDPAHFNAGNRRIMFVKQFTYLGIVLDEELSLTPLYKDVVRQVEQKLFLLRKIRNYITKFAAMCVYKQMILPIFDFAGFMLTACTLGQKRELRKLQNRGIRTCLLYHRREHISIQRLHNEFKILSLEQRRQIQLLKLLFHRSKNPIYLKIPVRPTRANVKVNFIIMSRTTTKYLNSPFIRGTIIWDNLPVEVQKSRSICEFKKKLTPVYNRYEDLL